MKPPQSKAAGAKEAGILHIRRLVRKVDVDPPHVFQVSRNALALFDATQPIHKLGRTDRRLLEAAALLHDLGHTIDPRGHHKHSLDLILKLDLPKFSDGEKRIIACVARYHRKAHPSTSHAVFGDLKKGDRERVEKLASILRIADGLDRGHEASCKAIGANHEAGTVTISVEQRRPSPTDIWGAQRKQSLFEEIFHQRVEIKAVEKKESSKKATP